MNKLMAFAMLMALVSPLRSADTPSGNSSVSTGLNDLPSTQEKALPPEIKQSNLTKPTQFTPPANESYSKRPAYTQEQLDAFNKERNWVVEGMKDRKEIERAELEKSQLKEENSLDELLEKERKSIDERMGKPTTPMNQLKPSIETNWNGMQAVGTEKEETEKKNAPGSLGFMQTDPAFTSLNTKPQNPKDSLQAFDPNFNSQNNSSANKPGNTDNLQALQNQMSSSKPKEQTNFDYLVNTGQATNFRKLSNDPNYELPTLNPLDRPSIDAVPSAPKPVTSTMSIETMRQIEQQRMNAIPKPDFKELNSRIPDPGARKF